MPPERFPPDDPREWLNRARSNLAMAKNRVAGAYLEDLCFEAQQAAEKAIKAVMIKRNIEFPYVHDLGRLLELLKQAGEEISPDIARAGERTLMWHGEVLQMIVELKQSLAKVTDTDAAWKQINYFTNNQERMDYGRYRDAGWPIGSGLVEGQCKFLVARRFKGNGMRWRPDDNRCVLRTRLALLNGDLKRYFSPPADCEIVAA